MGRPKGAKNAKTLMREEGLRQALLQARGYMLADVERALKRIQQIALEEQNPSAALSALRLWADIAGIRGLSEEQQRMLRDASQPQVVVNISAADPTHGVTIDAEKGEEDATEQHWPRVEAAKRPNGRPHAADASGQS